jgi:hypothetical protein
MAAPFNIDDLVSAVLAGYQRAVPPARQAHAALPADLLAASARLTRPRTDLDHVDDPWGRSR